jgi:hypothetical protein
MMMEISITRRGSAPLAILSRRNHSAHYQRRT